MNPEIREREKGREGEGKEGGREGEREREREREGGRERGREKEREGGRERGREREREGGERERVRTKNNKQMSGTVRGGELMLCMLRCMQFPMNKTDSTTMYVHVHVILTCFILLLCKI